VPEHDRLLALGLVGLAPHLLDLALALGQQVGEQARIRLQLVVDLDGRFDRPGRDRGGRFGRRGCGERRDDQTGEQGGSAVHAFSR
jgi:hypothetical protein